MINVFGLTSGRSSVDAASYNTASILPTNGRLALVGVVSRGTGVPTLAGNSQTWAEIRTVTVNAIRLTVFAAVIAGATAGVLTINFGAGQSDCSWSVLEIGNITGSPIVQHNSNASGVLGAASLTVTLAAFGDPNNGTIGFFGGEMNSNGWGAAGSGFTGLHSQTQTGESGIFTEYKVSADTTVDANSGGGDISFLGIALEIATAPTVVEEFIRFSPVLSYPEEFIRFDAELSFRGDRFIRFAPVLSYPEEFIRFDADMEAWRTVYLKMDPDLQAAFARYIKLDPDLEARIDTYLKFAVDFGLKELERFIKLDALLAKVDSRFIRWDVEFNYHARFIRFAPTLVLASNLPDVGDEPTSTTKPGIMSRQYLSVVSVKKEVS